MTTHYTIICKGYRLGVLYKNDDRTDGINICACDDATIDSGGEMEFGGLDDEGAEIWKFLVHAEPGAELVCRLTETDITPERIENTIDFMFDFIKNLKIGDGDDKGVA